MTIGDSADMSGHLDPRYGEALVAQQRYESGGQATDLDIALQLGTALLRNASPRSADELVYLNFHASNLLLRYRRDGNVSDLSSSIDLLSKLLQRAPVAAPQSLAGYRCNFGRALIERFEATKDRPDLVRGITALEESIAATDRGSANWIQCANQLAIANRWCYAVSRDREDLSKAIDLYQEILDNVGPGSPYEAGCLQGISDALLRRYEHVANIELIEPESWYKSDHLQNFIGALRNRNKPGSPDRSSQWMDSADAARAADKLKHSRQDLARAVSTSRRAVDLLTHDPVTRGLAQLTLAGAMTACYQADGDRSQLQAAIDAWREGCQLSRNTSQAQALKGAVGWTEAMIACGEWTTALEAYEIGVGVADDLYRLQLTREHREVWMEQSSQLYRMAGYALAKLGRLKEAVVEIERGRAIFLSEGLDQIAPHGLAESEHGNLADNYHQAASADRSRTPRPELDQANAVIRTVSGYEEVISAAAETPLVYICTITFGGFALLVDGRKGSEQKVAVIWLDKLTDWAVYNLCEEFKMATLTIDMMHDDTYWRESLDFITERLFDIVTGPVLASFPADHLTFILGGRYLDYLPLHAAWRKDIQDPSRRHYAIDESLITYAPSARAMHSASKNANQPADKLLAVFDPKLPQAEQEIQAAQRPFSQVKVRPKDQVTREALLGELREFSVLHFACHASADLAQPLRSHLNAVSDGLLTLGDLFEQRLKARLAILSACDSALAGGHVPDQAVSLPTGFLQAGAAGVVGTLWPVRDRLARMLLADFYKLWQDDGLQPAEALRRAQLRVRDQKDLHPAYWAAFIYVGA